MGVLEVEQEILNELKKISNYLEIIISKDGFLTNQLTEQKQNEIKNRLFLKNE